MIDFQPELAWTRVQHAGYHLSEIDAALASSDVVVTATGELLSLTVRQNGLYS